jgi:hypothetical protein
VKRLAGLGLLVLFPIISFCQSEMNSGDWDLVSYKLFKKDILRKKKIRKIICLQTRVNREDGSVYSDTAYYAEFDSTGNVLFECDAYSRWDYYYSGDDSITIIQDETSSSPIYQIYKAGRIVLKCSLTNKYKDSVSDAVGDTICEEKFFYNGKNKLCEVREIHKAIDYTVSLKYFYNDVDSLIKTVTIAKEAGKIDSTSTSYIYDSANRLKEIHFAPSPTFYKTFVPLDYAQSQWHYYYSYDSCTSSFNVNDMPYHSTLREYFNGGYIEWRHECYGSTKKKVYSISKVNDAITETYGSEIRIITYNWGCNLEIVTCLPVRIEYINDSWYDRFSIFYLQ